jgi:hypothetical protein
MFSRKITAVQSKTKHKAGTNGTALCQVNLTHKAFWGTGVHDIQQIFKQTELSNNSTQTIFHVPNLDFIDQFNEQFISFHSGKLPATSYSIL